MVLLLSIFGFIARMLHDVRPDHHIMYMASPDSQVEQHNVSVGEMMARYRTSSVGNLDRGFDRHLPEDDPLVQTELLRKLFENNEKMKVLRTLENTSRSVELRAVIAEDYLRNHSESPLTLNLSAGGLYSDWEFDI